MSGRGGGTRIPRDVLALAMTVVEGAAPGVARRNGVAHKSAATAPVKPQAKPVAASGTKAKIVHGLRKLHPMD